MHHSGPLTLEDLLDAGGWTTGAGGTVSVEAWDRYVVSVGKRLGVMDGHRVFEVGCGAGAFLYSMSRLWDLEVVGVDYSEASLAMARNAIPTGRFEYADISENDLPAIVHEVANECDTIIVNSVIAYLPSIDVVERLLNVLLSGSASCALLDIPNEEFRTEAEQERAAHLPPGEYKRNYLEAGLSHLYVSPAWLEAAVNSSLYEARIETQDIPGFRQSRYHFNAFLSAKRET
jgi:trans-aconitate methyltransferase